MIWCGWVSLILSFPFISSSFLKYVKILKIKVVMFGREWIPQQYLFIISNCRCPQLCLMKLVSNDGSFTTIIVVLNKPNILFAFWFYPFLFTCQSIQCNLENVTMYQRSRCVAPRLRMGNCPLSFNKRTFWVCRDEEVNFIFVFPVFFSSFISTVASNWCNWRLCSCFQT